MTTNMLSMIFVWIGRALVLLTAMPVHEYAHGYIASRLGDQTARNQGRLTLNPLRHLDPLGSILLIFTGFGWAKPVQVDPRYFKNPRKGMALTSLAGPVSNILLALVTMILYKLLLAFSPVVRGSLLLNLLLVLLDAVIFTNLYIAVFNLLPVPPLDGAKIFGAILPDKYYFTLMRYERYIALVLMVLIFANVLTRPLRFAGNLLYNLLDIITLPINLLFR